MNCRGTFAEIDLKAIKHNLSILRQHCGNSKILMAVKADAYGHGAVGISGFCESEKLTDAFGVASIEEGRELRKSGIKSDILLLGLILHDTDCIMEAVDNSLILSVADISFARMLVILSEKISRTIRVHIKTDTGMGRIGCSFDEIEELTKLLISSKNIKLEGIFTHMPVSDTDDSIFNETQLQKFKSSAALAENISGTSLIKHMANSGAILRFKETHLDMVRAGIVCYGYPPVETGDKFIPVMTLKSRIIFSKRVKKGTGLSYGLTYAPDKDSNIATAAIGYGDGYNRLLSNNAHVIIRNRLYPVAGRVCMDQILINTFDDIYDAGEEIILFGKETINAQTIASAINTIPYEITCNISKRVPRVFIN
ncbi:MAG TPA: alanine racemase [Spirochaetota bacterium]|nr:alanine racemase [Spirochaetota bacterium]HOR44626.1 alanine racemase [Spirochaetota bacterium]HPK56127.1 alanine racemase [Spirochaetota bacterium]